jgi:hypothetical protein
MGDGISGEGGLGYYAVHNQELNCLASDSETENCTPRSGWVGPRLDKHGTSKAGNKSAGKKLRSGRSF